MCWIMLNPSRADEVRDDPTIRRCTGFARQWGFGSMVVVNLFAFCTADPAELRRVDDPVGPGNDDAIRAGASRADIVVAAWGRHGALRGRDADVTKMVQGHDVRALGRNLDGSPTHPLYVRADTSPEPFMEITAP